MEGIEHRLQSWQGKELFLVEFDFKSPVGHRNSCEASLGVTHFSVKLFMVEQPRGQSSFKGGITMRVRDYNESTSRSPLGSLLPIIGIPVRF